MQSILSNFLPVRAELRERPEPRNMTRPHRAITRPKPQKLHFFPRMHHRRPSLYLAPCGGGVAENAGQSRFLPLWAISSYGPLWLFPENY
jgi:hypothetical protein